MRYRSYKLKKKDYLREALERVTADDGMSRDLRPDDTNYSEAVRKAWFEAKMKHYIRQVNLAEVSAFVATQRGIRETLLAMMDTAARDESREPEPWREGQWGIKDVYRSMDRVIGNLHDASIDRQYWTLTHFGANYLEIPGYKEQGVKGENHGNTGTEKS